MTSRMPGRLCEADSGADVDGGVGRAGRRARDGGRHSPQRQGHQGRRAQHAQARTRRTRCASKLIARIADQAAPRTTTTLYKRTGGARRDCARRSKPQSHDGAGRLDCRRVDGPSGARLSKNAGRRPAGGSMLAVSRTLRDGLMSAFEFLCIVERDGGLVYTAMPNGRTPATDFTLTKIDDSSATFENPAHDFPR